MVVFVCKFQTLFWSIQFVFLVVKGWHDKGCFTCKNTVVLITVCFLAPAIWNAWCPSGCNTESNVVPFITVMLHCMGWLATCRLLPIIYLKRGPTHQPGLILNCKSSLTLNTIQYFFLCLQFSSKVLELARKQRMNTDIRRNIFCVIMTSEDYLDAFEKLLR